MTQDRIECPFCSELIMRDAVKCRFCKEWLSARESSAKGSHSIEEIAPSETLYREPRRGEFADIRGEYYCATTEGVVGRHGPGKEAESQSCRALHENDDYAGYAVRDLSHAKSGLQSDRGSEKDSQFQTKPLEEARGARHGLVDGCGGLDRSPNTGVEAVDVSPTGVAREVASEKRVDSRASQRRTGIPWLRVLMFLSYIGIVGALAISESRAYEILGDARAKEIAQEHDEAFDMYRSVLDSWPFSFGTIETRRSLKRLCQLQERDMPEPSWLPAIKKLLGSGANMPDVHLLPLTAWPMCAALLFSVILTRIFRPSIVFLAFLLMVVAIAGSVAQFAWYGSISLPLVAEAAQRFMRMMPAVYVTSYLLLLLTALMTLTSTKKRPGLRLGRR